MIRESVAELYGDWGIGKLGGASAGGIQSKRHGHISHIDMRCLIS